MAKTRVGINGFGRIGRNFFRAALERGGDFEIVAFNDLGDVADDGAPPQVRLDARAVRAATWRSRAASLVVAGAEMKRLAERDPAALPWGDLGVDVVIESTGLLHEARGRAEAPRRGREEGDHLGARDRPGRDARARRQRRPVRPRAAQSSRTPRARRTASRRWRRCSNDTFGIERGFMTTIHAYTNDQQIHDLPHSDLRRARAAAINLIPTSTGAARAIGLVLPELDGKVDGISVRAPVPTGSITDLVVQLAREATVDEVNAAFARRRQRPARAVPRVLDRAARLDRHQRVAVLVHLRQPADDGEREPREGLRLVRQRVGLLVPARRSRRQGRCDRGCRARSRRPTFAGRSCSSART